MIRRTDTRTSGTVWLYPLVSVTTALIVEDHARVGDLLE